MLDELFSIKNLFIGFFACMAVAGFTCLANIECLLWSGSDPINDASLRVEAIFIPLAVMFLLGAVVRMAID